MGARPFLPENMKAEAAARGLTLLPQLYGGPNGWSLGVGKGGERFEFWVSRRHGAAESWSEEQVYNWPDFWRIAHTYCVRRAEECRAKAQDLDDLGAMFNEPTVHTP